jgi:hypothetical protein
MNNTPTPETDAEVNELVTSSTYNMVTADFARQLERERDEALTALMEIEEIFVDGSDTYEDWKSMGTIARKFLSENVQGDGSPSQE